jgi:hypothetical protein
MARASTVRDEPDITLEVTPARRYVPRPVDSSIRRDLGHELRRIVDRAIRAGVLERFRWDQQLARSLG